MIRLPSLACLLLATTSFAAPPGPGFHPRVSVTAGTRLDWTFALSNRSLESAPATWLGTFDSTKQTYELFVPTRRGTRALPVILYLSPGNDPGTWKTFERLARTQGILYAAPRGVGNDCPPRKRVRIVLDVLDDLRRHHPIDPDRTYLAGFSGGGRIACAIAFALPELFGGIVPICAGGNPRDESWLRQRAIERLSVALLTGDKDFNRGEVERLRGPYLKDVGVSVKVWTQKGLGHGIPGDKVLAEAYRWLEDGLPRRQALAKRYPATRLEAKQDASREALAGALLSEGRKRLTEKGQLYAGLMQVKGVSERWPDLEAGKEARKLLLEYDGKSERPWEADDVAEQRRFLVASARALTGYGTGPLDGRYEKMRTDMLREALRLWQQVTEDGVVGKEAKKQVAELEKRLGKE